MYSVRVEQIHLPPLNNLNTIYDGVSVPMFQQSSDNCGAVRVVERETNFKYQIDADDTRTQKWTTVVCRCHYHFHRSCYPNSRIFSLPGHQKARSYCLERVLRAVILSTSIASAPSPILIHGYSRLPSLLEFNHYWFNNLVRLVYVRSVNSRYVLENLYTLQLHNTCAKTCVGSLMNF